MKHHPDKGGNPDKVFILLQISSDKYLKQMRYYQIQKKKIYMINMEWKE